MAAPNWKKYLKTALKFIVSGGALYVVFLNIDWDQTRAIFLKAHFPTLVVATVFFVLSKIASAFRLHHYFRNVGMDLPYRYNIRLYWVGMFYNLFLPGGIGGDGYKVYLLNKQFGNKVKSLVSATLLDRISGMIGLIFLAGVGYMLIPDYLPIFIWWMALLVVIVLYPLYFLLLKWLLREFLSTFHITNAYSLAVQGLQVVCAYFILVSLGVNGQFIEYQVLFLLSSVVAVFPFTIGGVGARELTFILGYQYLQIDQNVAVAFSFLFFAITAIVSLVGGFISSGKE